MDTDPDREITLRIKSASHKYADDVCFLVPKSSTVKHVKELIHTNFPFHPEIKEQRLIYAGHILQDEQVFSDFLIPNTDGGEEMYVVHLCCTNSFTRREREEINATKDNSPSAGPGQGNEELLTNPWAAPQIQVPGGVPQEILSLHQAYLQQMLSFMTHWNAGYYAPLGAQLPGFNAAPAFPGAGAQFPPQMYYQQMGMGPGPDMGNLNFQQPAAAAGAAPPQQARPAPPPRMPRDDAEEGGQADMLDWMYTLSRVALIFSVVYFYSNLTRLLLVIIFMGLVYIMQRRAREPAVQNNNNPAPARPAPAQAAAAGNPRLPADGGVPPANPPAAAVNAEGGVNPTPAPAPAPNAEAAPANEGTPLLHPAGEGAAAPEAQPSAPAAPMPEPPPRITVWGFVSAFVTSLIPDMAQHA